MKILRKSGLVRDLYYISDQEKLNYIYPTIPITKSKYEDNKIPRISLGKNIDKALMIYAEDRDIEGQKLYVYRLLDVRVENLIDPGLTSAPRVGLTEELWYLVPLSVEKIGALIVGPKIGEHYFDTPRLKRTINTWDWKECQESSKLFSKRAKSTKQVFKVVFRNVDNVLIQELKKVNRDETEA